MINSGFQKDKKRNEEKKEAGIKSQGEIFWDSVRDFFNGAILKTPVETIFEAFILLAGAIRTYDFLNSMGSSATLAISSLVYSEIGIPIYEWMNYRGRKAPKEKIGKDGKTVRYFPAINQKSVSTTGIWLHIFMSVFFTGSDILKNALSGVLGSGYNLDVVFSWMLGIFVAIGVFSDLVLILNYRRTDPYRIHEEKRHQLDFDRISYEMELEEIRLTEALKYGKRNAPKLVEQMARMEEEDFITEKLGSKLGADYVRSKLKESHEENNGRKDGESIRPPAYPRPEINKMPPPSLDRKMRSIEDNNGGLPSVKTPPVLPEENTSSNQVVKLPEKNEEASVAPNFQNPHQK